MAKVYLLVIDLLMKISTYKTLFLCFLEGIHSRFLVVVFIFLIAKSYGQFVKPKIINTDSVLLETNIPFINSGGDSESGALDDQEVSSLLQSSRDVFVQFAVFQFSAGRYRMRAYPSENQIILFNGINVSNLETGYSVWNQWGGLNDISRYAENRFGNDASRYAFTGPGGYVHIDSKASSFRKGSRISSSFGNRLFRQRLMFTHSTGMMKNGWAFTFSASWRYGNEVYIPGTHYNSKSFFVSIDKQIHTKHLLNFSAIKVNTYQGRASAQQNEVYDLANTNYYNSNWGLQNGKVRNAAVSKTDKPILILYDNYKINSKSQLNSKLLYTFGKSGYTSLNWNDASNARPNYYRNLPSYFYSIGDSFGASNMAELWKNDINTSQINWDQLIALNQNNLYALPGEGIITEQTRARYILENRIENLNNLGFNSVFNSRKDKLFLSIGVSGSLYRNRKYKIMEDLLGATYWLDYDQFAENLGVSNEFEQNDIEHPDKKIYTGDKFGYDYSINIDKVGCWSQIESTSNHFDFNAGLLFSTSKIWREGFVANGKFPNNSKGPSEAVNFVNAGIKGGITYKITGRHFLSLGVLMQNRNPEVNSIFISERTRNTLVNNLQNEQMLSGDINYNIKYPGFKARLSGYYTQVRHQTWLRNYWHDEFNNSVNLIMKNLNQTYSGIELGLEKTILTAHQVQAAFGYGASIYSNRPTLEAWQDNNNTQLYSDRTSYLSNYFIGGSPQTVFGLGYRFSSPKYWFVGVYLNSFDRIYSEINPERRTSQAIDKFLSSEEEYISEIIKQEKLPSYSILNFHTGKSFRIRRKYYLNFSLVVYNALNNKNNRISGFEQLRWDKNNLSRFDNKYTYMQGTSFMLNFSFTFN